MMHRTDQGMAAADQPVARGDAPKLAGYEHRGVIGRGASATVHRCVQRATGREVAVKVGDAPLDARRAARLRAEVAFLARLSAHPHILTVLDVCMTDDGRDAIVSEYAPGGTMKDLLAARRLDAEETLDAGVALASALACAHRAGIVHRDVKPGNVLIDAQGLPVLADFGVAASLYDRAGTGYSLPWAPPEALRSDGSGTDAGDVYSLGATLYAMLAGASPFEHGRPPRDAGELAERILRDPLPPIGRSDVPDEVERVIAGALSRDPQDRPSSALAFARAMQRAQETCFGRVTPVTLRGAERFPERRPRAATSPAPSARTGGAARGRIHRARRRIVPVAAFAAGGAVLALFAAALAPHLDRAGAPEAVRADERIETVPGAPDAGGAARERVPSPTGLTGSVRNATAVFTWRNPDPREGDRYVWSAIGADGASNAVTTDGTTACVGMDGAATCIEVSLVRADRRMSSEPATACVAR